MSRQSTRWPISPERQEAAPLNAIPEKQNTRRIQGFDLSRSRPRWSLIDQEEEGSPRDGDRLQLRPGPNPRNRRAPAHSFARGSRGLGSASEGEAEGGAREGDVVIIANAAGVRDAVLAPRDRGHRYMRLSKQPARWPGSGNGEAEDGGSDLEGGMLKLNISHGATRPRVKSAHFGKLKGRTPPPDDDGGEGLVLNPESAAAFVRPRIPSAPAMASGRL